MRSARVVASLVVIACGCSAAVEYNRRNEADTHACEAGDAPACLRIARVWRDAATNGLDEDHTYDRRTALELFDRGCAGGIGDACSEGAAFYDEQMTPYEAQHHDLYERLDARACELVDDQRCLDHAARTMPADPARTVLLRRVCTRTIARCPEAARLALATPQLAVELARRPCDAHVAATCSQAAALDLLGTERDMLLAASCDLGTGADCYSLGKREEAAGAASGIALDHYKRGCALGHADACIKVGQMHGDH